MPNVFEYVNYRQFLAKFYQSQKAGNTSFSYQKLAKAVRPEITAKQARKSVELLERLGLIARKRNGSYRLTEKNITTGPEVAGLAVQNYHKQVIGLAAEAVDSLSPQKNITALTLGITETAYESIVEEISACRSRIVALVNSDNGSDRVYQLNFQLYPLSTHNTRGVK